MRLTRRWVAAICIETRQANAAMDDDAEQDRSNDARALAQIMRTGWYQAGSRQEVGSAAFWRSLLVAGRRSSTRCGQSRM